MVWQYNPHEDFVPYYDKLAGKWAVSIQYLGIWHFKTKENAESAIPRLKTHRKSVLRWVEEENKAYYRRKAEEEGLLKKELAEYRRIARENQIEEEKLCKQLSKAQKFHLNQLLDAGYSDEEIMELLPISKRTVALKRWHRYKVYKNEKY